MLGDLEVNRVGYGAMRLTGNGMKGAELHQLHHWAGGARSRDCTSGAWTAVKCGPVRCR